MSNAFITSDAAAGNVSLPPAGSVVLPPGANRGQIDNYIRANFGYMAWALQVPELRAVLEKAVGPNGLTMDQNTFDGLVRNTNWYKNNTQAMRSWVQMLGEDPKTANAQLEKAQAGILTEARMMGLNLDPTSLQDMAGQSIAYQWDKPMMDEALYAEAMRNTFRGTQWGGIGRNPQGPGNLSGGGMDTTYAGGEWNGPLRQITGDPFGGGLMSDYYAKVQQYANDYMVTVSPTTAAQWAIAMSTGQMDPSAVEGSVIKLAMGKFPTLAQEIQSGTTPKQYFDPIAQEIAKTLEIPVSEVDFANPTYSQVLQYKDPTDGKIRPMTISEADNWARQQPGYQRTQQFAQQAASLEKTLSTSFGVAKYSG